MNGTEFRKVQEAVELEGMQYAFLSYSDFKEINDPEFHKVREAYVAAHKALAQYCGLEE